MMGAPMRGRRRAVSGIGFWTRLTRRTIGLRCTGGVTGGGVVVPASVGETDAGTLEGPSGTTAGVGAGAGAFEAGRTTPTGSRWWEGRTGRGAEVSERWAGAVAAR
ncbi:hypothetical protein ADK54_15285 [Streptomyces sp. WM6378]|nr:hypothetical protein ADK54_15285 [Streptomyces sp. WM6378]